MDPISDLKDFPQKEVLYSYYGTASASKVSIPNSNTRPLCSFPTQLTSRLEFFTMRIRSSLCSPDRVIYLKPKIDQSQKTMLLHDAKVAHGVLRATLRVPEPIIGFYSWSPSQRLLALSIQWQSLQHDPRDAGAERYRRRCYRTRACVHCLRVMKRRRESPSGESRGGGGAVAVVALAPHIGLCLSVIRGRLPVPTQRSIVINTPHHGFSHSGLHLCLRIECRTETNACVYLPDISFSVLL